MARLTAHATAADSAAAWHTLALEARTAIGTALRQALADLAIDPAAVPMLRVSDEAAQELRTAGDRPKTNAAAPALPVISGMRLPPRHSPRVSRGWRGVIRIDKRSISPTLRSPTCSPGVSRAAKQTVAVVGRPSAKCVRMTSVPF